MKNKFIILLALAGMATSCSDAYDITQKGEQNNPTEVYQNANDISLGINAIYASIPARTEIELGSIFTDEAAIGLENGGQGLLDGGYTFYMEADNDYAAGLWSSYYAMIHRINRLEATTKELMVNATNAEKGNHNNNLAELYALRAFAHYKLFAYFTPDYAAANGKSIINLDHVPPTDYTYSLPRNTVKEVSDFIIADLDKSVTLRTKAWTGANYVNSGMIDAIRVKLYSMLGDTEKVLQYGLPLLQSFSLSNGSEYTSIFARVDASYADLADNKETIFRLKSTINSGPRPVPIWYSVRASSEGSPFFEMGRSLYNELDKLDNTKVGQAFSAVRNDVRYAVNVLPSGTFNGNEGSKVAVNYETLSQSDYTVNDVLLVGKYRGMVGANTANSVPMFRVADILLAVAEARAAQGATTAASNDPDDLVGDYSNVYSILYTLRFNRLADRTNLATISIPQMTSAQAAYAAILNERRVEFAFEGGRYLDMKRLGVKAGSPGFVRYSKDCADNGACQLAASSHKLTLPIPVGELNGNTKITSNDQNPGY